MNYKFFKKAKQQADLQDFCNYLEGSLNILEEINEKYQSLSVSAKSNSNNMVIYLRIDKIINQYLPNMVDNFCDFSFDYRNKEIIKKIGELEYTAKDMLLMNLSKLIQEIKQIEKEFNEQNKFSLLVQEKILTNLGYELEFDLYNKQKLPELKNKFDYDIFKKNNKKIIELSIDETEDDEEEEEWPKYITRIHYEEFLLVVGLLAMLVMVVFVVYAKVEAQSYAVQLMQEIKIVENNISYKYNAENKINKLDVNQLVIDGYLPKRMYTGVAEKLKLNEKIVTIKLNEEENGYTVTIPDLDMNECRSVVKASKSGIESNCLTAKNDLQLSYKK